MNVWRSVHGLLVGTLVTAAAAPAQQIKVPSLHDASTPMIEVMILGVFHFHNPNADYAQFEGIDMFSPERQTEIETVVDALQTFGPTVVAVERPLAEHVALNRDYRAFLSGTFDLTANEVHQLGFRLASRAGHEAIFPVDHRLGMRMDSLFAYAEDHAPEFRPRIDAYIGELVELLNFMQRTESIGANLQFLNEPENVLRAHEPYAVQSTLGAGDGYVGARVVSDWYERNLHIFANLANLASPGDRLILIIGAGHAPLIRHLVRTHPDMRLVEPNAYLRAGQ